jgi:hypothetical protein
MNGSSAVVFACWSVRSSMIDAQLINFLLTWITAEFQAW